MTGGLDAAWLCRVVVEIGSSSLAGSVKTVRRVRAKLLARKLDGRRAAWHWVRDGGSFVSAFGESGFGVSFAGWGVGVLRDCWVRAASRMSAGWMEVSGW